MRLRLIGKKNIFEEIADQYKNYIRLGVLSDGDKLPSCRELAIELGINPNTVERAYSLLEAEGLVVTLSKKGTYVASKDRVKTAVPAEAEKQLSALRAAGLTLGELSDIIGRVYNTKH